MKALILSFLFSLFLLHDKTGLKIDKHIISLSIDKNTSIEQLNAYKAALLKRNINLSVEKIDFDEKQKIKYIKIAVDCNDGFKGTSGETLMNENTNIGFYRIYNSKDSPFGMNPLPEK